VRAQLGQHDLSQASCERQRQLVVRKLVTHPIGQSDRA
jgi:hypothetical protein